MNALSPGGETMFKDSKDIWNLKLFNRFIQLGGWGDFNVSNYHKAISGKKAEISAIGLNPSAEVITGSSNPADLKTLFEMIYLQFTSIRKDETVYNTYISNLGTQLKNSQLSPNVAFNDSLLSLVYNNNPRNMRLKTDDLAKINYDRVIEMYKDRFADASDFTFSFVGNITIDSIRPLIEQYLATLPALNRKDTPDEKMMTPYEKGKLKKHFAWPLETPISTIELMYTGQMEYNLKNLIITQVLNEILDLTFMESVREDKGASYMVIAGVSLFDFPLGRTAIDVNFDTDPMLRDKMLDIVKNEIFSIANDGPRMSHLNKSVSSMLRKYDEIIQENEYWLNAINSFYFRNFNSHHDYVETLKSITIDDVKKFTKQLLDQGNEIEIVMFPKETINN